MQQENNDYVPLVNGTPFSVLMDHAVAIKTLKSAPQREKYDQYPTFLQKSIFNKDNAIIATQKKSFDIRMEDANNLKEDGNQAFRELRFDDALLKYEMAISSFRFLLNHNENIRTEVGSRTRERVISNWVST